MTTGYSIHEKVKWPLRDVFEEKPDRHNPLHRMQSVAVRRAVPSTRLTVLTYLACRRVQMAVVECTEYTPSREFTPPVE